MCVCVRAFVRAFLCVRVCAVYVCVWRRTLYFLDLYAAGIEILVRLRRLGYVPQMSLEELFESSFRVERKFLSCTHCGPLYHTTTAHQAMSLTAAVISTI